MKEQISALMDDELDPDRAERVLAQLSSQEALRREWACYHLIGDALRGEGRASDCSPQVMSRLESEATVIAFAPSSKRSGARWLMPVAAACAGVAVVAWLARADLPPESATASVEVPATPTPADPMQEYILAHHGYAPAHSMQGAALYARTVSDVHSDVSR